MNRNRHRHYIRDWCWLIWDIAIEPRLLVECSDCGGLGFSVTQFYKDGKVFRSFPCPYCKATGLVYFWVPWWLEARWQWQRFKVWFWQIIEGTDW